MGAANHRHGDEAFFVAAVFPWIFPIAEITERPSGHELFHALGRIIASGGTCLPEGNLDGAVLDR